MTTQEARAILGDRAHWELIHMKKALSMFPVMNTDEEKQRLEAVKVLLKPEKRCRVCGKRGVTYAGACPISHKK